MIQSNICFLCCVEHKLYISFWFRGSFHCRFWWWWARIMTNISRDKCVLSTFYINQCVISANFTDTSLDMPCELFWHYIGFKITVGTLWLTALLYVVALYWCSCSEYSLFYTGQFYVCNSQIIVLSLSGSLYLYSPPLLRA